MPASSSELMWQELVEAAKEGQRHEGWLRHHAADISQARVWYGIRIDSKSPALMLDVPAAACSSIGALPATAGISVSIERFADLSADSRAIAIVLRQAEFIDLFAVFGDDLVSRLAKCKGPSDAVATLLARIDRWQRFLTAGQEGLSEHALVGFFGELIVLRDIVIPLVGPSGVFAWTGPDRELKDFQFARGTAIEVKSTSSSALSHVQIHHESQLTPGGAMLFLICLRLSRGAGININDLITELRTTLAASTEQSVAFERCLYEAGYWDRHAMRYEATMFALAEQRVFTVSKEFPSVSAEIIPSGVDNVSYRLALAACSGFETSIDAVKKALLEE
jgi:hypothetical protein